MKSFILYFVFANFLALPIYAQSPQEYDVAEAVESLRKEMLDGDREALERLSAEELSYGHSSGLIEDKAAFVEALASGKSDFLSINLSNQVIKVVGNTAIVRHNLNGEVADGGKQSKVNIGILLTWINSDGQWKLLARQAFKL
jgi:hypothetical protein